MTEIAERIPLIARAPGELVGWWGRHPITVAELMADAAETARRLPAIAQVINACGDRYAFLVGFVACILRERPCLLPGGQTPRQIEALRRDYPDSIVLTDRPETARAEPSIPIMIPSTATGGAAAAPALDPHRVGCIAFTSGTTGAPVAHARNLGSLLLQMTAAAHRFHLVGPETISIVATVPQNHMYGFETTILMPLRANVAVHGGTPLYPKDVRGALEAVPPPRILVTSPVHLRALSSSLRSLPELRSVISATAPLDGDLAARIEAECGTQVLEIYGCTEVGSLATRRTVQDTDWLALDGVILAEVGEPKAGVVSACPPYAFPVPLHDVITVTSERQFRLAGRREDMIKVGGKRGSLAGLTSILLSIEGVQDGVFVIPERGAAGDARPAVIVSAPGVAPDAILNELRQRIDPAFVPRRVVMVERLPRNPLGKLPTERIAALLSGSGEPEAG